MTNPWNIDKAFEPMFTDTVSCTMTRDGNSQIETSVSACVYPAYDIDPFSEVDADGKIQQRDMMIMKQGWSLDTKPQIGDVIALEDTSRWSVSKVQETQGWFSINTRSI